MMESWRKCFETDPGLAVNTILIFFNSIQLLPISLCRRGTKQGIDGQVSVPSILLVKTARSKTTLLHTALRLVTLSWPSTPFILPHRPSDIRSTCSTNLTNSLWTLCTQCVFFVLERNFFVLGFDEAWFFMKKQKTFENFLNIFGFFWKIRDEKYEFA